MGIIVTWPRFIGLSVERSVCAVHLLLLRERERERKLKGRSDSSQDEIIGVGKFWTDARVGP